MRGTRCGGSSKGPSNNQAQTEEPGKGIGNAVDVETPEFQIVDLGEIAGKLAHVFEMGVRVIGYSLGFLKTASVDADRADCLAGRTSRPVAFLDHNDFATGFGGGERRRQTGAAAAHYDNIRFQVQPGFAAHQGCRRDHFPAQGFAAASAAAPTRRPNTSPRTRPPE